jgi:predicted DNA-binding mobile mystery protein A
MRAEERDSARRKLDKEMRPFRQAGKQRNCTTALLRAVRQALGIRAAEIAREMGVHRSVLFRLERSEARGAISLDAMEHMAESMDCMVVYGVVPRYGRTLEELAERRRWKNELGKSRE